MNVPSGHILIDRQELGPSQIGEPLIEWQIDSALVSASLGTNVGSPGEKRLKIFRLLVISRGDHVFNIQI